ncbi:LCP family protein [Candidatus Dependentiae bacterium]|nr:LCP family protein [Candidatus Dependentiae bacterium]
MLLVFLYVLIESNIIKIFNNPLTNDALNKDKSINVLIAALTDDNQLSSLYLFSFEPVTCKIGVIYFPWNSLFLQVSSSKNNKLYTVKELYSIGGFEYLIESLENDFKIKIPYYLGYKKIDFIKSMDLLSGMHLRVANPIKFYDRYEKKWYLLPAGTNDFLGYKLSEYLEYDKDIYNENNLTYRKSNFVKTLFEKLNSIEGIENQSSFMKSIHSFISYKNMNFDNFNEFILSVKEVKVYDITFDKAPGQKELHQNIDAYRLSISKSIDILPKSFETKLDSAQKQNYITVEILNGSSLSGSAEKIRKQLQKFVDVDVQFIGNAKTRDYANTLIIDKKNNLKSSQRIKEILGFGEIKREIDENSFTDVTIILGNDIEPEKK